MNRLTGFLGIGIALLSACALDRAEDYDDLDDDEIGEVEQEGRLINGRLINGRLINGRLINGTTFSGSIKATKLDHVLIAGKYENGVTLTASSFRNANGSKTGAAFVGATFDGLLSTGATIPLRVDARRQIATDLFYYKVSYQVDTGWVPMCGTVSGVATEVVPLNGVWNYAEGVTGGGSRGSVAGQFTFACLDTALGKCVNFGYVPWRTKNAKLLLTYHDACARAVRADYCGDGRSFTSDGTLINMFDAVVVNTDTETWPRESQWAASGALCLTSERVNSRPGLPTCATGKVTSGCKTTPLAGMLVQTEYSPN